MQHNNSVRQHFPICIPAPLCTHPADSGFLCGSRDYLYSHCSPHCPQRLMLLRQTAAFSVLSNKEKGTAMAVVPLKQRGQLCGHTREYITKNPKDREKNGPCSNSNLGSVFHQDIFTSRTVWISFFFSTSIMRFFNNGFPCLCRLSSSSSAHYKQTLNGCCNPR